VQESQEPKREPEREKRRDDSWLRVLGQHMNAREVEIQIRYGPRQVPFSYHSNGLQEDLAVSCAPSVHKSDSADSGRGSLVPSTSMPRRICRNGSHGCHDGQGEEDKVGGNKREREKRKAGIPCS
jgi:hypothetical protein